MLLFKVLIQNQVYLSQQIKYEKLWIPCKTPIFLAPLKFKILLQYQQIICSLIMITKIHRLATKILNRQYIIDTTISNRSTSKNMPLLQINSTKFSDIKNTNSTCLNGKDILVDSSLYKFGLLEQKDIDNALKLTVDIILKDGPQNKIRYQNYLSKISPQKKQKYYDFVRVYLQNSVRRHLAQGIFCNKELIGVSISQDINFAPANYRQIYHQSYDFHKYDMAILKKLDERLPQLEFSFFEIKYQIICIQFIILIDPHLIKCYMNCDNTVIDMWNTAIKQEHRGKGLLKLLVNQIEQTAIRENFKYIFVVSTNCKISATLKIRGYYVVSQTDIRQILVDEQKPFENIEEENKLVSYLIKPINEKPNQQ